MEIILVPKTSAKLIPIRLPQPKNGLPQIFLYDEENIAIYELTRYDDKYRSWFANESLLQNGQWNALTYVDPLFIYVPIMMRFATEKYRTIHDICTSFRSLMHSGDSKLEMEYFLSSAMRWDLICDIKKLDDESFVRFNQTKTLSWLLVKHKRVVATLKRNLGDQTSIATLISYAVNMIDLYLPACLSDIFKDMIKKESFDMHLKNGVLVEHSMLKSKRRQSETSNYGILNFLKKKTT